MSSLNERLVNCFALVFPEVDRGKIPHSNFESIEQWDSVRHVNLLSLIGEEFGIEVDFEHFDEANSFESIRERLLQIVPD